MSEDTVSRKQYDELLQSFVGVQSLLVNRIDEITRTTYCAYCGTAYMLDDQSATLVTNHIYKCEKHPLSKAMRRINELETALVKWANMAEEWETYYEVNRSQLSTNTISFLTPVNQAMKENYEDTLKVVESMLD